MGESRPRPRARSVPVVYGGVSVSLMIGVLALALVTPPPSTPPLAAVAPAPQEQVKVERVEQDSRFGDAGTGTDGGECTDDCIGRGPELESAPDDDPGGPNDGSSEFADPAGYHRCVSGPGGPRQTEDPQSPPCVAQRFPLGADNGGVTATGVTADAIQVAVPVAVVNEHGASPDEDIVRALATHFNDRYEFYGRRLEVEFVYAGGSVREPGEARAFAREVAAREPFAALDTSTNMSVFFTSLAESGVISTTGEESFPVLGLDDAAAFGPYLWSVFPSVPASQRAIGDLVCTALAGRPARHAGPQLSSQTRRFGVLVQTYRGFRVDPFPLTRRLEACGVVAPSYDTVDDETSTLDSVIARMQADQVTTVICSCYSFETEYTKAAERAGFEPEWVLPYDDLVTLGETRSTSTDHARPQLARTFGITPRLRRPGRTAGNTAQDHREQYWFTALREADPVVEVPPSGADRFYGYYAQLLVLASGIQHAGPDLTPDTFAEALRGLRYSNPAVGLAPWFQSGVGFGPGDHTFVSDWALFWFELAVAGPSSGGTVSNQTDKGQLCYVGDGARFTPGTWPGEADDAFFDAEAGCR